MRQGRSTREEWAARVARQKESGLSVARFAAEIGVNAKTLAWWRAELAAEADGSTRALARVRHPRAVAIEPLKFIEMTGRPDGAPIEIVLRSGISVRVQPGFDSTTLTRVLDTLEARPR